MNILKPQKVLFDKLRKVNNLLIEFNDKDKIENVSIESCKEEIETNMNYTNLSMASMENVLMDNVGLRNSNFQENMSKLWECLLKVNSTKVQKLLRPI